MFQIRKLKQEAERQHKLRAEIETMCGSKVKELQKQCDFSTNKIVDLERHMQNLRKREHATKVENTKLQGELSSTKLELEEKIIVLEKQLNESEDKARLTKNTLENELGEFKRLFERLQMVRTFEIHLKLNQILIIFYRNLIFVLKNWIKRSSW